MVDPVNFTNFNRTDIELEEMILFSVLVAGKNAITTSKRLDLFLVNSHLEKNMEEFLPFECLRRFSEAEIAKNLLAAGIGCYNTKGKSVCELVNSDIDLRNCSVGELEKIHGIGSKTSRMFLLHSRKDIRLAVLDVHILRYMKDCNLEVPKNTPSNKNQYKKLEVEFLKLADKSGMNVADFDLHLWRKYSGRAAS